MGLRAASGRLCLLDMEPSGALRHSLPERPRVDRMALVKPGAQWWRCPSWGCCWLALGKVRVPLLQEYTKKPVQPAPQTRSWRKPKQSADELKWVAP